MSGPLPKWKVALLDRTYRSSSWHWLFRLLVDHWDGGQFYSRVWRDLLRKYSGVDVGRYTYGPLMQRGRLPRGTRVGSWCSVGRDLIVRRRNHPVERVTQHPFFYNARLGVVDQETIPLDADNPLTIGHDVWIGDRVMILSRCRSVGNGAVLAGGSVVTKDVPPYAIVAGIPARVTRYRFSPEIQQQLEDSCWWELDVASLASLGPLMIEAIDETRAKAFADACRKLRQGPASAA